MLGSVMTASSFVRQSATMVSTGAFPVLSVRSAPAADTLPVHLLEQVGYVGSDQVGHLDLHRFRRRQTHRFAHRLFRPLGVAPAHLGETPDVGRCIVDLLRAHGLLVGRHLGFLVGLLRLVVLVLFILALVACILGFGLLRLGSRRATDVHGRRCAEIRAGSHGSNVARIEDVGAGAGSPGAARSNEGGHRHGRGENVLDDLAHGGIQPAWRVHFEHHELSAALLRFG